MNAGKLWREGRTKSDGRWIAGAVLIAVLVLGPLGAFPGSVASAQEDVREEPFPEVGGTTSVGLVVVADSDREEPFPEVSGQVLAIGTPALVSEREEPFPEVEVPILATTAIRTGKGARYTDVLAFYSERLRARISLPYTDVSAFHAESKRSSALRDLRFSTDPLLGLVGIDSGAEAAMSRTPVSAFYAERQRAARARDLRLVPDSLLGALGIDLERDTWMAGGNTCVTC